MKHSFFLLCIYCIIVFLKSNLTNKIQHKLKCNFCLQVCPAPPPDLPLLNLCPYHSDFICSRTISCVCVCVD